MSTLKNNIKIQYLYNNVKNRFWPAFWECSTQTLCNKNMQQQFHLGRERKLVLKWNKQIWCQNFVFFQSLFFWDVSPFSIVSRWLTAYLSIQFGRTCGSWWKEKQLFKINFSWRLLYQTFTNTSAEMSTGVFYTLKINKKERQA